MTHHLSIISHTLWSFEVRSVSANQFFRIVYYKEQVQKSIPSCGPWRRMFYVPTLLFMAFYYVLLIMLFIATYFPISVCCRLCFYKLNHGCKVISRLNIICIYNAKIHISWLKRFFNKMCVNKTLITLSCSLIISSRLHY